jgi:hypothetical protein
MENPWEIASKRDGAGGRGRDLHTTTRAALKLPRSLVLHSLRHTFVSRLGLAGVEALRLCGWLRTAGCHQPKYVHPIPQAMEDAVARLKW